MRELVAEVQFEQKRQAEALLLANRKEGLSKADVDMDNFSRPPNLEIVQISSPKFVSIASVENTIKPYMETQQISPEIWSIVGNIRENAFQSSLPRMHSHLQNLHNKFAKGFIMRELMVQREPARNSMQILQNLTGMVTSIRSNFLLVLTRPRSNDPPYICLKKLLKLVKRFILKASSHFGKLKVLCRSFGKGRKILSKMLPTSATVDESMVQWDPAMVHKFRKRKS